MWVREKTHPTKLTIKGTPEEIARVEYALDILAGKDPDQDDDTIPAAVIQRQILDDLGTTMGAVMLKHYREVKRMTQAELGAAVGVSKQHIHALENGRRPIGKQIAAKLARVLGVDPGELLKE